MLAHSTQSTLSVMQCTLLPIIHTGSQAKAHCSPADSDPLGTDHFVCNRAGQSADSLQFIGHRSKAVWNYYLRGCLFTTR